MLFSALLVVCEVVEVVIIEALIAKLTVEVLDVGILRRFTRNQLQIHTAPVGPAVKRSAGEFRTLVGPNGARRTSKLTYGVEHAMFTWTDDASGTLTASAQTRPTAEDFHVELVPNWHANLHKRVKSILERKRIRCAWRLT